MKVLCGLTEWDSKVCTRGRGKGNTVSKRIVVCLDKWNFSLGVQRGDENQEPIADTFYASMASLFPNIHTIGVETIPSVVKIVRALSDATGIAAPELPAKLETYDDLKSFGSKINGIFNCNYCSEYPPTVRQRILKDSDKADDAAVSV